MGNKLKTTKGKTTKKVNVYVELYNEIGKPL